MKSLETKQLHERNFKRFGFDLNLPITVMSIITLISFVIYSMLDLDRAATSIENIKNSVLKYFDSIFVTVPTIIFIVLIVLAFSKVGKVKIAGKDSKPKFSRFAWYAMLFSAGMGIGLLFFSVYETLEHMNNAPLYAEYSKPIRGLVISYNDWGIQAWAIYALFGLSLGYFAYNLGLPLSPRSIFYPLIKNRIYGLFGDIIDTIALLTALIGLSASLGLGSQQINAGLLYLFGVKMNTSLQVVIITLITAIATLSVVSGINKGVRLLSEWNIKIATALLVTVFILGSTTTIIFDFLASSTIYLRDFLFLSNVSLATDTSWSGNWVVFYYAWWLSWAPFVGVFVAKISKGRTVKDFILSVIFVPTLATMIWFAVFGSSGISANNGGELYTEVSNNIPVALFALYNKMGGIISIPFVNTTLSIVSLILVVTFFVTSSDSGSLVVDSLASGGNDKVNVPQKVFWAVMEGVLAATLLIIGGAQLLKTLQNMLIIAAVPLLIIVIFGLVLLTISLINYVKKSEDKMEPS